MPKIKTHSSTKKRVSVTGTGKFKKNVANRAHKLTGKSSKRKISTTHKSSRIQSSKNMIH